MSEKIEKLNGVWTRRGFLTRVGQVGGASALYETMVAMGLISVPTAWAGMPKMSEGHGVGKSVLILGAGIGGLTTAYNLSRYGYNCRILEATSRAGGRNHTARRGSTILEDSPEHGKTAQECLFDDGLYLNLGPGRLTYHHSRMLGYCQKLNVELEPYIANTTGNLFQTSLAFDQKPVVYGEVQNDTRGYITELLAKSVSQGLLNAALDEQDRALLLSLLDKFGALEKGTYKGSGRTGCGPDTPNVFKGCEIIPPRTFDQLLESKFWNNDFYQDFEYRHQSTLFQPVGGMDMIVEGFLRQIGNLITYNAPVVGIELQEKEKGASKDRVSVKYMNGATEVTATADYCVSNIPCPVLTKIPANFSDEFSGAVSRTKFGPGCKVGWQCNTRFWESQYGIFGGISWTNDIITQIWYPSNGYFTQKGTLTGAYIQLSDATEFAKYSLEKRLQVAKKGAAKLHPEFLEEGIVPTKLGLSIAWQNVPYLEGAWPNWESPTSLPVVDDGDKTHGDDDKDYRRLLLPDGRFHIVGDQTSTLPGWQEGAMMSAEWVVELIAGTKGPEDIPDELKAPSTSRVLRLD